MKNILKYAFICIVSVGILSAPVYAQEEQTPQNTSEEADVDDTTPNTCANKTFLGLPAWYNGLAQEKTINGKTSCEIKSPREVGSGTLRDFILVIVFNIVEMILRLAGYAAVAFIIYGGYRYMTSAGSADGIAAAKKTITNAVIGLVLSIAAVAIVNTISNGLSI